MNKKFVLALIIFLCLVLVIILIAIFQINKNKSEESDNIDIYESVISNNEKKLFEYDNTLTEIKYDKNQLEDIDLDLAIEVMAMDENIDYIIENEDLIKSKIKEYILLKNINGVTMAIYEEYQKKSNSDMIAVAFILDNKKETELIVIIDKNNNTINVKEK